MRTSGAWAERKDGLPELFRLTASGLTTVCNQSMCDRREMFESLIYDRSKEVFEYFGLPYEAPRRT